MKLSDSKNEILISVSLCLFCYNENEKKVLTVRNKNLPFKNALVLPNKLLKYNQSLDEVCTEILTENIRNQEVYIEQKESISSKVGIIIWNMWRSRSNPTETNKLLYKTASIDFKSLIDDIKLLGNNIKTIESYLEENKVPYTPGRGLILDWEKE